MRPLPLVLTAALLAAAPAVAETPRGAALLFERIDADSDGRVTAAEMTAAREAQFTRMDRNADGQVDPAEIEAARARLERFTAVADAGLGGLADRRDADGDGNLSRQEFTAQGPMLALLDTDGDGAVSRAEFDRVLAILAR
jgi:Ca2+-binding EF-hand superfamily protein